MLITQYNLNYDKKLYFSAKINIVNLSVNNVRIKIF